MRTLSNSGEFSHLHGTNVCMHASMSWMVEYVYASACHIYEHTISNRIHIHIETFSYMQGCRHAREKSSNDTHTHTHTHTHVRMYVHIFTLDKYICTCLKDQVSLMRKASQDYLDFDYISYVRVHKHAHNMHPPNTHISTYSHT